MLRDADRRVRSIGKCLRTRGNLSCKALERRRPKCFPVNADRPRISDEREALQLADKLALDQDITIIVDGCRELFILAKPLHQHAGATVHEALGQLLVQSVREPVFDRAGPFLPMRRIGNPLRTVGDVGPSPDMCDALGDGIDLAFDIVEASHMPFEPGVWKHTLMAHEMLEDVSKQLCVFLDGNLPEIGNLAHLPELPYIGRTCGLFLDARISRKDPQHQLIVLRARAAEAACGRQGVKAVVKRCDGREIKARVSPLDHLDRIEPVVLDGLDQIGVEWFCFRGHTEGAVIHVPASTSCDLRQFVGPQRAAHRAIEFLGCRKGDMVDVHVQPHADRIRRNQEVHIAGLVQRNLRITGSG